MIPWKRILPLMILVVLLISACQPAELPAAESPSTPSSPPPPTDTPIPPTPLPEPTPESAAKPATNKTGTLVKDEITSQALEGNLLDDPTVRPMYVFLPPGYEESNKRYPVVYVLHWYTGRHFDSILIIEPYKELLQEGGVGEMILVSPDASNKFGGSKYLSSPTIGDYETYIARELVDYIDANYRTIPHKDSRGITGCSMGGDGSIHLALTYPDVFGVTVPMSAEYDYDNEYAITNAVAGYWQDAQDFRQFSTLGQSTQNSIAKAAAAAPNPDTPPFYLDMPVEFVDGKGQAVPEVWQKIAAVDVVHDVEEYLAQPERLNGILLIHGVNDRTESVELARSFDQLLTEKGIEHEYLELDAYHCDYSEEPALQYLADHLVFEE